VNTPPETAHSALTISPQATPANGPDLPATPPGVNPNNPPWGLPAALITWFLSIAAVAVVPNLCALPYVWYHFRGAAAPTREILLADKTFMLLFVSGWLPAHLLTLGLIWAVATRWGKFSIKEVFGWSWSPRFGLGKSIASAIGLYVLAMIIIGLVSTQETDLDRILRSSRAAALILAFIAVATAPLMEEMIYRGLLYSALQKITGPWSAVIVVSVMFAGLHVLQYWPNAGVIGSITLLSIVLTVVRARTGRLLPCFVIHLVFNGVQSIIIVIEPYLRSLVEHWRPQPTPGILFSLVRLFG
jgi:membrane protease YdiL (CAAX protease family)